MTRTELEKATETGQLVAWQDLEDPVDTADIMLPIGPALRLDAWEVKDRDGHYVVDQEHLHLVTAKELLVLG